MSLLNLTEDDQLDTYPSPSFHSPSFASPLSTYSLSPPPSSSSPSSSSSLSNCSGTLAPSSPPYNFYAVLLVLLIFCVVFGNVLVCVAVSRERSLQTTTNYLIVSLAVSDLLLATLVMPWGVYLEVVGEWRFSRLHCDILLTLDVMMCTASILNLCAISIDRYTAVAMPMLYNTRYSSRRRVALMIAVVWFLSFAISCPLLFGLNNTASQEGRDCSFADPAFVVYSSVASFYVPFIVTLLVYAQICVVLRRRGRRTAPPPQTGPGGAVQSEELEDVKLCTLIVKPPATVPQRKKVFIVWMYEMITKQKKIVSFYPSRLQTLVKEAAVHPAEVRDPVCCMSQREQPALQPPPGRTRVALSIAVTPSPPAPPGGDLAPRRATLQEGWRERTREQDKGGATKERVRGRLSQQKERKATQMLSIVLGVFIICWLPFFLTHVLKAHCGSCCISPSLYSAVTWLGYLNSAVNPIIYTTFNIEFRKAFIKILHC
uniref:G-protein coupled receptors family 1 profile domain-containing protein n=1 Tax=Denticeps clupeoides TaxID=299321 RepID=A0AAY4AEB7_9TELE